MQTPLDTDNALALSRKWTLRAHGRQVVVVKKRRERASHVLIKAFIWALYLPEYPDLKIEVGIGGRYTPDVVQLDQRGQPVFWGEAGKVSPDKWASLLRRFPDTHFALARWAERLDPHVRILRNALDGHARRAPIDVISLPPDAPDRFVTDNGTVRVSLSDLDHVRLGGSGNA